MNSDETKLSRLQIGTTIDMVGPNDSITKGILAEKLGFDMLWFTDHLIDNGGIKVEPWTTMSAISAQTKIIKMCTAVTDTQRSHPTRTAHSVATLDEISNGRVSLGIGAGEAMNLLPFGLPFDKPLARAMRLAEAIQVIRLLWGSSRSRPVSFQGEYFSLDNAWLDLQIKGQPGIYVGALGGRHALEIAGKYGDGWISWINTPDTFGQRLGIVKEAARNAGKEEKRIGAAAWIFTGIAQNEGDLRDALNYTKRSLLVEFHTLKLLGFEIPSELETPYQSMLVTDEGDRKLLDLQDSVPDEIAFECSAFGSPSEIIEKVKEFRAAGATHVILEFVDPREERLREYSNKILPLLLEN